MNCDLKYNYCALCLSIIKRYSPDEAFEIIEGRKKKIDSKTIERMRILKKRGFTYNEIAEIYEMTMGAVQKKIQRSKKVRV